MKLYQLITEQEDDFNGPGQTYLYTNYENAKKAFDNEVALLNLRYHAVTVKSYGDFDIYAEGHGSKVGNNETMFVFLDEITTKD